MDLQARWEEFSRVLQEERVLREREAVVKGEKASPDSNPEQGSDNPTKSIYSMPVS